MPRIPADIIEASRTLGPFLQKAPGDTPRQASYLFKGGAVQARRRQRWHAEATYDWNLVATMHRRHALHFVFDKAAEVVSYQQAFYYRTARQVQGQETLHTFAIRQPVEEINSRDYFTWRHQRDYVDAVVQPVRDRTDSHIYRALQAHQAEQAWAAFEQGKRLHFGALALQQDLLYFEDTSWPHAAHSITYIPPVRPLDSVVFGQPQHTVEDCLLIMRNDFTSATIPASSIANIGALLAIHARLYGSQWLSERP